MRTQHLVGLFLALSMAVGVIPLGASQSAQERPDRSRPAAQRPAAQQQETESPSGIRAGTKIDAQLESALDAKTAKPGDQVEARVTRNVKQDGRVVVHKGDRLIGKVVEARAGEKGQAGSQLNVVFDRLATAQGETQLNTVLSSVLSTPAEERERRSQESSAPAMMPPVAAPSGGGQAGGGLVGGVASTVGSTAGGALGDVGSTVGNVGGTVGAATQSTLGSASNLQLATPRREIHVNSGAQAQNQTGLNSVLSTRQQNLRLDSGTSMQFRVAGGTSEKKQ